MQPVDQAIADANSFRPRHSEAANFDTANPGYIRKYLRTYGLTPPRAESYETQKARCTHHCIGWHGWSRKQLTDNRSGTTGPEKHPDRKVPLPQHPA